MILSPLLFTLAGEWLPVILVHSGTSSHWALFNCVQSALWTLVLSGTFNTLKPYVSLCLLYPLMFSAENTNAWKAEVKDKFKGQILYWPCIHLDSGSKGPSLLCVFSRISLVCQVYLDLQKWCSLNFHGLSYGCKYLKSTVFLQ